ncbi:MAG: molybdopterin-dependent oxidoreductase [Chloroflexi bacterium]|nr:molybdopterin-dependent oxidoreductase [Chloroflexota bacterium]
MPNEITLTVDGLQVKADPGQTIIQAAMGAGIYIPYLCYWPGMKPYGACRMCVVQVQGQPGTPASCTLPAASGMVVTTASPTLIDLRRGILEMLLSEHPHGCLTCHRVELCGPTDICLRHVRVTDRCVVCPKNERCELKDTVRFAGMNLETPLPYHYRNLPIETKDPFYDRDYNLCIVCARCVRVCEEVRADNAIALVDRSGTVLVGTSRGSSLLESGCEFCGACVDVCPVGALVEREHKWAKASRKVTTTCPLCPVGCQVILEVDRRDQVIRSVGDWKAEANRGQLCFKGKFGMEFVNRKERLATPLLRKHGELVPASWDEALDVVAQRFSGYRGDQYALLVSPRATNEDAYVAQKFARVVMQTNNVDLSSNIHPELVSPLEESLGFPAATGSIWELEQAGCVIVVNSNTTEDHNVAAIPLKKGKKNGNLKLIVIDSREVELTRYANLWLRPRPGTEVTLLAGVLRVVLEEGLEDKEFLARSCQGGELLSQGLAPYTLAFVEQTTGVEQQAIAEAARLFARSRPGAVLYALDNVPQAQRIPLVRALVDLVLLTGNVGKPSSGLFPLRSGANAQGAWDFGCAPHLLPGFQHVADASARERLKGLWGAPIPSTPGVGANGIFRAIQERRVRALHVLGDSATFDDAALHTMSEAEFLVVHDAFLSGVAQQADVVLPAAAFAERGGTYTSLERRVQLLRHAVAPKGESRPDWAILSLLATRMGSHGFVYQDVEQVFQEGTSLVSSYAGISFQRLQKDGVQWPCPTSDHPGTRNLYESGFAIGGVGQGGVEGSRARVLPFDPAPAPAWHSQEFPLLYAPGRVLAQPQREITVMRGRGLNQIQREEVVELHPADAAALGVSEGDEIEVITPAGRVRGRAHLDASFQGMVSVTFLFGQLAVALEAGENYDSMLRVPRLDILPARVQGVRSA